MNREDMLLRIDSSEPWDIIIIGGGATGVGAAIDAASRGYRTLLLEQDDFAKGTSSRSTKLIHGGVRYLKQGNIPLVLESIRERGIIRRNAPHIVRDLPFIVPAYDLWEAPFYGMGLTLYSLLAGTQGVGFSRFLSKDSTLEHIPTLEPHGLRGGVIYHDCQFDDARMVINMAETAAEQGATLLNYTRVHTLTKKNGVITGLIAYDDEQHKEYELHAKVVVNATGVFADSIRQMDNRKAEHIVTPSRGTHIVVDRSFLPGNSAIMVPKTDDGRIFFAIPWHDCVILGTTDVPISNIGTEPRPTGAEIDFILKHSAQYLTKDPGPEDVRSIYAGLRPLASAGKKHTTAKISREHMIDVSSSGLVTIVGGKWTTYRKMALDTVDQAAKLAQLNPTHSVTRELAIHGYHDQADMFGSLSVYGSDAPAIQALIDETPEYGTRLHPDLPVLTGEVVWVVRNEMARTVEDVLSRRTRSLLLHARASIEIAPKVAALVAQELNRDNTWVRAQVNAFTKIAEGYIIH